MASATLNPSYHVRLFGFFFILFVYAHQDPLNNVTSLSRLDLLHALVKERRVTIDTYHLNTTDKAIYKGAYFSDKPPGTVTVALPGFVLAAGILRLGGIDLDSPHGWLLSSWLACAWSIGLVSALGACACFKWLCGWVSPRTAFIATCGLFLGAAPFPYVTMLFPHALVVSLICIALWLKRFGWRTVPALPWLNDVFAGLCCGVAAASEFTAGLVIVGLVVAFYWYDWRRARLFVVAAFLPLLLVPLYSWLSFGHPFTVGYAHQASFPQMKEGLFGIRLPDPTVVLQLLVNPAKGLFTWSPFLLLAIPGFRRLLTLSGPAFFACAILSIVQVVAISGYRWDWPAGFNLTPRYLSCVVPLLTLPAALFIERFRYVGISLVTVSIFVITSATLIDASPAFDPTKNYFSMYAPELVAGRHAPNLGDVIGLPGYWCWLPWSAFLLTGLIWFYKQAPNTPTFSGGTPQ